MNNICQSINIFVVNECKQMPFQSKSVYCLYSNS